MISECPNTDQDLAAELLSFIVSDNERYTASGKEEKQMKPTGLSGDYVNRNNYRTSAQSEVFNPRI
jgi:hypothetical protein